MCRGPIKFAFFEQKINIAARTLPVYMKRLIWIHSKNAYFCSLILNKRIVQTFCMNKTLLYGNI